MPMTMPRRHSHTRGLLAIVAVAIPATLIGVGLSGPSAQAAYTVTLEQVGPNVVATGSGTLDLTGLSGPIPTTAPEPAQIQPGAGLIFTGPASPTPFDIYLSGTTLLTGPSSFGGPIGSTTFASSGSGDFVGIDGEFEELEVPAGYTSGTSLSDTATYDNQTFAKLGATPGTYVWTWGSGAADDTFTLQIGPAAVPAPLIGHGLPVLLPVGGLLFGAKLLERSKRQRLPFD
jgi:hypothetical protein